TSLGWIGDPSRSPMEGSMSKKPAARGIALSRRLGLAVAIAALWIGGSPGTAGADNLIDPPVFASKNGVLDIMMVAIPQPIPTIAFTPPSGGTIPPTGWVYQICPRPASGLACPSGSATVSPYGGTRLALQPGDTLKIRFVNRLPKIDPNKLRHVVDP